MMRLNVLIGVAPQRLVIRLLRRLPRDSNHPRDGRERVMAQPQGDDLLLTPGNFLAGLGGLGVAATTAFPRVVCQLVPGVFSLIRLSNCRFCQLIVN